MPFLSVLFHDGITALRERRDASFALWSAEAGAGQMGIGV
jgi:hypothetical protein